MVLTLSRPYDEHQLRAIELGTTLSPQTRVVAVSGEAGTGKTSIIQDTYEKLHNEGVKVCAVAPTGKAARRIKQATGIDAMTIHMLLKYPQPGEIDEKTGKALAPGHPKHDRRNPIDFTVVLADEYAMVNNEVHRNLVDALPRGGCIRVYGDVNQLRPIEETKALADAPSNFEKAFVDKKFPTVTLQNIYRTGEGSNIPKNGRLILHGKAPTNYDDYTVHTTNEPIDAIVKMIQSNPDKWRSLQHQIITPSRKSWIGTDKLNGTLQSVVFQQGLKVSDGYTLERHKWDKIPVTVYVGDKVMFSSNNYGLNVFNGEVGIIKEIKLDGDIVIGFEDREVTVPPVQGIRNQFQQDVLINPQRDIHLAYAITTHKSQGSEWLDVCYVMNKSTAFMLNRRNFYTATSRARKNVTVITDHVALSRSLWLKG